MRYAYRVVIAAVLVACGSSSGSNRPAEPTAEPSPAAADPEAKLASAQTSAARAMCERLVGCSVDDARANLSPAEIEELELDTTVPKAIDECEDEADRSKLSPRQIKIVQGCVNDAEDCAALTTCLDGARRQ